MRQLVLAALAVSSFAFAADLKPVQEEAKTAFDKQMSKIVSEINGACGTNFTGVTSDFEHYDKKNFPQSPPGATCSSLTYAVKETCKSEPYKKALVSKIKGLACMMDGDATSFETVNGVFTYHMHAKDKASGIEATKALKAELDK